MSSFKVSLAASTKLVGITSLQGKLAISQDGSLIFVATHRQGPLERGALWLPLTGPEAFAFQFWQDPYGLEDQGLAIEVPIDRLDIVLRGAARAVHMAETLQGEMVVSEERSFIIGKPNMAGGPNAIALDGGRASRETNGAALASREWGLRGYLDDKLVLEADITVKG